MVKAPGVITGRYGTIGRVFWANEDFWPLNTTLYVEDFHGNYPLFVYYFLKTLGWEKFTSASAVPGINRNTVHKEIVCLPDIASQRRIALLLKTVDDKIEVNEKINDNLQQQAAALFDDCYQQAVTEVRFTEIVQVLGGGTPKTVKAHIGMVVYLSLHLKMLDHLIRFQLRRQSRRMDWLTVTAVSIP